MEKQDHTLIHAMCLAFQSGRTEPTHRETKSAWKKEINM